jgi:arylsulfatase I/J
MATPDHTPLGRGYDTSLLYFDAANGYWDSLPESASSCPGLGELTDLWANAQPAVGLNNSRLCSQANQAPGCKYEDELFAEHMVAQIAQHNASAGPFFGFAAWHNCHAPPEVPAAYLANFSSFIPVPARAMYAAKANYLDAQIGKVVAALKARGLWEQALIVVQSDNGAPLDTAEAGGSNHPLRGGKYSSWMGGIQTPALVSGGYLPPARRGAREPGLAHIADWWATLIGLAGGDASDARAAAAGLPPPDSLPRPTAGRQLTKRRRGGDPLQQAPRRLPPEKQAPQRCMGFKACTALDGLRRTPSP